MSNETEKPKTKLPQWVDKTPTHVTHPSAILRDSAKVLKFEAAELRKAGMRQEATLASKYADAFLAVANGATWADAFNLQSRERDIK